MINFEGKKTLSAQKILIKAFVFGIIFINAVSVFSQAAETAAPYTENEVTIETTSPNIRLAGALAVPKGKGQFPAALLIAGNGPHTRDQMISGSPMFRQIADYLARNGIAVLRVDKRGTGKSTGPKNVDESTIAEFAQDAQDCFNFLKKRAEIDPAKIGLIGHSEGGIVAPMVAVKEPGVRFVVLIAPSTVPGGEIWVKQREMNLTRAGAKPEVIPAVVKVSLRLVEFVKSGKNDDETYYKIGSDFLAAHGVTEDKINKEFVDRVISDVRLRWYNFFFSYDPAQALKKLKMPTLAVMTSMDRQVLVKQNLPPLVNALTEAENPDFTVTVMPDQDHFFLTFEGKRLEKHNPGKMEVNRDLLELMTGWIQKRIK